MSTAHVCGAQGFGLGIDGLADICPACQENSGQETAVNEWQPFTGDYEKRFYEARHPNGTKAIQHLWPNAGRLHATNGTDLVITPAMGMVFRRCTCGHKYGGCLRSWVSP